MRIEFNTHVERVDRHRDGWQITTSTWERTCEHLVVATGPDREPIRPAWDGQSSFTGRVSHAGHLVSLDHIGMPPFTAATSSPDHPGLWFFGLNRSIYGNMHIRRREARHLAHHITGRQRA
jgi:hypothetical protein